MNAKTNWPLQSQCDVYFGNPRGRNGKSSATWERENLAAVRPPFRMTYAGLPIKSLRLHQKCAASFSRILSSLWDLASHEQKTLDAWGVSIYGGGFNYRLMRGGASLSMHSYGCAIDLDPARNAFHDQTGHFHELPQVVEAFEREGWTWGGRWSERSCDPMHFQAARVG